MALSTAEREAQIRQTEAFINADPVDVAVSRRTAARVAGGGVSRGEPVAAGSRRARMIPGTGVTETRDTNGSPVETVEWTLMALPTEDFQEGDLFDFAGRPVQVASVTPGEYQLKARVVSRG